MFIIRINRRIIRARAIDRLILAFVSVFIVLFSILILFAKFPVFFGFVSI
jgi:hypothetical protein